MGDARALYRWERRKAARRVRRWLPSGWLRDRFPRPARGRLPWWLLRFSDDVLILYIGVVWSMLPIGLLIMGWAIATAGPDGAKESLWWLQDATKWLHAIVVGLWVWWAAALVTAFIDDSYGPLKTLLVFGAIGWFLFSATGVVLEQFADYMK